MGDLMGSLVWGSQKRTIFVSLGVGRYSPSAYYVHCFAHRLQLALVVASREVVFVYEFFSNLSFTINVVGASCKRHDELQATQAT
jgi:hypothetical protein